MPESSFATQEVSGKTSMIITTEHISGMTALEKDQEASVSELQHLIKLLMSQTERIVCSLAHGEGVGYDVALHNFILRSADQAIFCVDFTPPPNHHLL